MKKILIILSILLLSYVNIYAAPFLVCDSYPTTVTQPNYFYLYINGATTPIKSSAFKNTDNSVQLKYDGVSLPVGQHTVQVSAVIEDVWGVSESSKVPFTFTKRDVSIKPSVPSNIGLAP